MSLVFPFRTDFDFAGSLESAVNFCLVQQAKGLGRVVHVTEHGPGGGNPNVEMEFDNDERLRQFFDVYAPNDPQRAYEAHTSGSYVC